MSSELLCTECGFRHPPSVHRTPPPPEAAEGEMPRYAKGCPDCAGQAEFCDQCLGKQSDNDPISAPAHYIEDRKYEPRRVAEDWGLNCNTGPALKYLARYQRKGDPLGDLKKARQYIDFEIERFEEREGREK